MASAQKWEALCSPLTIKGKKFKNRMMRSGMYEGMATEQGIVTPQLEWWIERQARGGAACIFPGYSNVCLPRCMPFQTGSYSDDHIPGLRKLADIIHSHGAIAGLQLAAAGRQANPNLFFGDEEAAGPSAMEPNPLYANTCREMTEDEIWQAVESNAAAAVRAEKAGFDIVLPNAAHGYLLAAFLSPHTNKRTDQWGGSTKKRLKFFEEVIAAVRSAVSEKTQVWTKISVNEPWDDGIDLDEAKKFIPRVAQLVDAVEITGGTIVDNVFMMTRGEMPIGTLQKGIGGYCDGITQGLVDALYGMRDSVSYAESYWYDYAKVLKPLCGDTPLILTGGHKYPGTMNKIVQEGTADMLSMARVLAAEPNFPADIADGREDPCKCSFCNRCIVEVVLGSQLRCFLTDGGYTARDSGQPTF